MKKHLITLSKSHLARKSSSLCLSSSPVYHPQVLNHHRLHSFSSFSAAAILNHYQHDFTNTSTIFKIQSQSPSFLYPTVAFMRSCSTTPESAATAPIYADAEQPIDKDHAIVAHIFSQSKCPEDITNDLESNNLQPTYPFILKIMSNPDISPAVARPFFDWALAKHSNKVCSKSYNFMLANLALNGFVQDFWNLLDTMKVKGYGVSKRVHTQVLNHFQKQGLDGDADKLAGLYASGSIDNSVQKVASRLYKLIRNAVWNEELEARIRREPNVAFSNDLVKLLLESLASDPVKAFLLFRWVEETGMLKHDGMTYNAMLLVLGREDCIDRFWKVANEMREAGYGMKSEMYITVLGRLIHRKMLKEAVDLYEFAMLEANKPSVHDCTLLLKKISVNKEFDMDLFTKVVRISTAGGVTLTNSMLNAVMKSLTTVGRSGESGKILKEMVDGGLVPKSTSLNRVAFGLSRSGEKNEASKFVQSTEASSDRKTWSSLIEGYCVTGDLDSASDNFKNMVQGDDVSYADHALELLVNAFCCKHKALDVYEILFYIVSSKKELRPWHTTYKSLIRGLLVQGKFDEALNVIGLMKNHGYPPFLDPFLKYISKTGTADDAITLLKAMTVKRYPSPPVFFRVFEAFFGAKRHSEAQTFLSKCPSYIRNRADVLDLFCTMKSKKTASAAPVAT